MTTTNTAPASTRPALTESRIAALRADVATARRTFGVELLEDAIRGEARRYGIGAPEFSAMVGAWPVCAGD